MTETIDQLLNAIANGGVIGGCTELCENLNGRIEEEVCNVLCDIIGIEAFIKLVRIYVKTVFSAE